MAEAVRITRVTLRECPAGPGRRPSPLRSPQDAVAAVTGPGGGTSGPAGRGEDRASALVRCWRSGAASNSHACTLTRLRVGGPTSIGNRAMLSVTLGEGMTYGVWNTKPILSRRSAQVGDAPTLVVDGGPAQNSVLPHCSWEPLPPYPGNCFFAARYRHESMP